MTTNTINKIFKDKDTESFFSHLCEDIISSFKEVIDFNVSEIKINVGHTIYDLQIELISKNKESLDIYLERKRKSLVGLFFSSTLPIEDIIDEDLTNKLNFAIQKVKQARL